MAPARRKKGGKRGESDSSTPAPPQELSRCGLTGWRGEWEAWRAAGGAWRRGDLGAGPRGQAQARSRGGARAGGAARCHPGHLPPVAARDCRAGQGRTGARHPESRGHVPLLQVPSLDLPTLEEVVRLGGMPEFGYCTISPAWQYASPDKVVQAIKLVGASRCMLVSDTGQRHNPLPSEALRIFAQTLFERGITEEDIHTDDQAQPQRPARRRRCGGAPR